MRNISVVLILASSLFTTHVDTQATPPEKEREIGISVFSLGNPYFKRLAEAAVAEAEEHGFAAVVVDAELDAEAQIKQVRGLIEREVAAIIVCPLDAKEIGNAIAAANSAGIPVVTADVPCRAAKARVVSHVGTDNLLGGRQAAEAMIEALGQAGGKVVILDFKSVEACRLRTQGFTAAVAKHNQDKQEGRIKIVAQLDCGASKLHGMKAAEEALQAFPNLHGIFAINDPAALGACAALRDAGKSKQVSVVSFDGMLEARRAIQRGTIYAAPAQQPNLLGINAVQAAVNHINGEEVEAEVLVPTKLYREGDARNDPRLR